MRNEKPSASGLMSDSHEVKRLNTLIYKTINSSYYNPGWGLDWLFWLDSKFELAVDSFLSYITQEAMKQGIVVTDIEGTVEDFILNIRAVVDGIEYNSQRDFKEV